MSDRTTGDATGSQAQPGPGHESASPKSTFERLDEAESMRLISPGGVGRLAYSGRFGLTIMPVNYRMFEGSIVFRTRFLDYTGVYMIHCHMMNHEEVGMMQTVEVYKD